MRYRRPLRSVAQGAIVVNDTGNIVQIKRANIAIASSGDNTVVSAVVGKKIRVVALFMVASNDVVAYLVDGADTALAGDGTNGIDLTANSGFSLNHNPAGWVETAAGQSFDINLDGAVAVAGACNYVEI